MDLFLDTKDQLERRLALWHVDEPLPKRRKMLVVNFPPCQVWAVAHVIRSPFPSTDGKLLYQITCVTGAEFNRAMLSGRCPFVRPIQLRGKRHGKK